MASSPAPAIFTDDVIHSHSMQNGMDLSHWLVAEDCVDMFRPVPIYNKYKNHFFKVGCRDDTVPKAVGTRRHCEED